MGWRWWFGWARIACYILTCAFIQCQADYRSEELRERAGAARVGDRPERGHHAERPAACRRDGRPQARSTAGVSRDAEAPGAESGLVGARDPHVVDAPGSPPRARGDRPRELMSAGSFKVEWTEVAVRDFERL